MFKRLFFAATYLYLSLSSMAQDGWSVCKAPDFKSRVDDIFFIQGKTGYAVCGDGQIVKSIDSGNTWTMVFSDTNVYFRSVEFVNELRGFVGGFPAKGRIQPGVPYQNVFLKTLDGGRSWINLTYNIDPIARNGICGLSVADPNTIYGCGTWFTDSAYIIKSTDGGNNWKLIPMYPYASSLIDLYFINKDTGFATGASSDDQRTAVILFTTDGGITWTPKFRNGDPNEYCWKIQQLTDQIYFASIEDLSEYKPSILKSIDGGMNWTKHYVQDSVYNIEGIGFIDPLKGFTGGGGNNSFESDDGGFTWKAITVCPYMDRVFRVSENKLFATGLKIWKYERGTNGNGGTGSSPPFINLKCYPNPVDGILTISFNLSRNTRAMLTLYDSRGRLVKNFINEDKPAGDYQYQMNTDKIAAGGYYILLKTHEDKQIVKVLVAH